MTLDNLNPVDKIASHLSVKIDGEMVKTYIDMNEPYYKHREPVRAVQFNGQDLLISAFDLRHRWSTINMLNTPHGRVPIVEGDWIVTDGKGNHVYTNKEFHEEFKAVRWE